MKPRTLFLAFTLIFSFKSLSFAQTYEYVYHRPGYPDNPISLKIYISSSIEKVKGVYFFAKGGDMNG